jgi:hypothetical protein
LLFAFYQRLAAAPALVVAVVGLLTVFAGYVQRGDQIAWHESTALACYGLAGITSAMILLERKDVACE